MIAYITRRSLLAVLTLFVISFLSYIVIQLPEGDFLDWYIWASEGEALTSVEPSPEDMAELRDQWGLNRPLMVQYWDWITDVIQGDFGYSFFVVGAHASNRTLIAERIPFTILLTFLTIMVTWTFAIPIGIYSAMRQHSIGDFTLTLLGFTGLAVPDFLLGLVLMYLFLAHFNQSVGGLFSGGYETAPWSFWKFIDLLKHMVIPLVVLGTSGTAGLIRVMRNNLLDELSKPYVVTAQAKGLPNWKVIAKYPVRIAINPFVSSIGAMFPTLIGGSIIVSIVLSLDTLGPLMLTALQKQDINLAGIIILLLASLTVVGVLISDLLLVVVDPRIKLSEPKS